MKKTLHLLFIFAATQITVIAGCTRKSDSLAPANAASPPPFILNFRDLTEIEISRDEPTQGTRWSARLRRTSAPSLPALWEIASAPENEPLHDRLANGGIVQHLLDTLNGARLQGPAPRGSAASLGLEPPRAAFRWKTSLGGSEEKGELWVGNPVGQTQPGFYARINGGSPVILLSSSFQRLLEHVSSFRSVRELRLLALPLDDIDELECQDSRGKTRYAQRGGDTWMDLKDKPLPASSSITQWLTRLGDWGIAEFLPERAPKRDLAAAVILRSRGADLSRIQVWREGALAFATVTGRPGAVFRLQTESAFTRVLTCPAGLAQDLPRRYSPPHGD